MEQLLSPQCKRSEGVLMLRVHTQERFSIAKGKEQSFYLQFVPWGWAYSRVLKSPNPCPSLQVGGGGIVTNDYCIFLIADNSKTISLKVLGFEVLYSMQIVKCSVLGNSVDTVHRLVMFPVSQGEQLNLQIGTEVTVYPPW